MRILLAECSAETLVKGSRFLAEALVVSSQAQARERLSEQKRKYADATHVVHAFVCGAGAEVNGMSDDGEPSGTAGRPVLDVLKGSGITNILLTVTRWFGGTLLGTGGLVHAYSDAAKQVLAFCKTEELVAKTHFSFCVDYAQYEIVSKHLETMHVSNKTEAFDSQIVISGDIWLSEVDALCVYVQNLSRGRSQVSYIT